VLIAGQHKDLDIPRQIGVKAVLLAVVTIIDACKEDGLETNVERTKYILRSRYQNAGENGEEERVLIIAEKAKGKVTIRKSKT
jgi:hypothetical protein